MILSLLATVALATPATAPAQPEPQLSPESQLSRWTYLRSVLAAATAIVVADVTAPDRLKPVDTLWGPEPAGELRVVDGYEVLDAYRGVEVARGMPAEGGGWWDRWPMPMADRTPGVTLVVAVQAPPPLPKREANPELTALDEEYDGQWRILAALPVEDRAAVVELLKTKPEYDLKWMLTMP